MDQKSYEYNCWMRVVSRKSLPDRNLQHPFRIVEREFSSSNMNENYQHLVNEISDDYRSIPNLIGDSFISFTSAIFNWKFFILLWRA